MLKPTRTPSAEDLRKNMLSTYFFLRTGIVAMSAALPIALLAYSLISHGRLEQHSMSAFYGAYGGEMRNWFVGTLCALGAFLVLYKGFSFAEDMALNLAGLFAVLVAMKPCNCWDEGAMNSKLHLASAFLFFAAMAYVCFFCAKKTVSLLPNEATRTRFTRRYHAIGIALILSPAAAIPASYLGGGLDRLTFFIEWFAVWVFAFYWFTKTQEFEITAAEKRALRGELAYVKGVGLKDVRGPGAGPPAQ
jgi:hypothetical protein